VGVGAVLFRLVGEVWMRIVGFFVGIAGVTVFVAGWAVVLLTMLGWDGPDDTTLGVGMYGAGWCCERVVDMRNAEGVSTVSVGFSFRSDCTLLFFGLMLVAVSFVIVLDDSFCFFLGSRSS
jgi:hypothetical protein